MFLRMQIRELEERKRRQTWKDSQYYKPHFGPEETQEIVTAHVEKERQNKKFIYEELNNQMEERASTAEHKRQRELQADLQFLNTTNQMFREEQRKRMTAQCEQTHKLTETWNKQLKAKQDFNNSNNIFQVKTRILLLTS
jgi:hypothetical protein